MNKKIKVIIDITEADDVVTEFGHNVLDGNGIMGVDENGVYFMRYGSRTDLVIFKTIKEKS